MLPFLIFPFPYCQSLWGYWLTLPIQFIFPFQTAMMQAAIPEHHRDVYAKYKKQIETSMREHWTEEDFRKEEQCQKKQAM